LPPHKAQQREIPAVHYKSTKMVIRITEEPHQHL
jgi:hypothetical protein